MANQIAREFATRGEEAAALATADHIDHFWDPRMKAMIFERLEAPDHGLSPIAARALTGLRDQGAPPSQTRATEFNAVDETGGSDAG
ncbi:MAG: formate dehydrogenase subunit delta [Sphingomonadaceae bacterium]|nr:formate dehydrogenase subunit delta [Sphingomonadaceae bacterium]